MKQPCDEAVMRAGAASAPCTERSRPWVLAGTILGSSMAFIDGTVVNVALPALQAGLHATVVDVQWVVEAYGLFLAALLLVGGALGDTLGRRTVFVLGVAAFGAASMGCGLSSSVHTLVIWRSVQGIAGAFLVPGSLAIISASFDEGSRGKAIGTWSGFTAITTALGPVLGGWLIEHASWHWVFFINVPLAAVVIAISLWHVPESRNSDAAGIDWIGAVSATLGLAGLVYGFLESGTLGWRNPRVLGSLVMGAACLALFVFAENRVKAPMMPGELFQSRSFSGANLLTLFLYAALGIFFFLYPLNLIQIQKYSATMTGAAALPMILLLFLLSRWSGGLVTRYGPKIPLMIGPTLAATGFALFILPTTNASYWTKLFPGFAVLGLGMAISVAPLTTVVMTSVGQARSGTASGVNNAISRVSGVLAVAVLGPVMVLGFAHSLHHSLAALHLGAGVDGVIEANLNKLAAIEVPSDLSAETRGQIQAAIAQAFVFGFRIVMVICAGLALSSAAVAARMIPSRHPDGARRFPTQ